MKRFIKLLLVIIGITAIMLPLLLTGRTERVQRTRVATRIVERLEDRNITTMSAYTQSSITYNYIVGFDLGQVKELKNVVLEPVANAIKQACPASLFGNNVTIAFESSQDGTNWTAINKNGQNFTARYIRANLYYQGTLPGMNVQYPNVVETVRVQAQEQFNETYYEDVVVPDPTPIAPTPGRGGGIQRR